MLASARCVQARVRVAGANYQSKAGSASVGRAEPVSESKYSRVALPRVRGPVAPHRPTKKTAHNIVLICDLVLTEVRWTTNFSI